MKKILVIDDSELVSRLLKEALKVAGYEVAVAMDANQGYSQAIDFHPDLILLDVQLPDVTGFELCRVIKNRDELRSIPIIMVTGSAHRTEEKVKGFALGADDYVMKPFEMAELLGRIQAILRRSERSAPVAAQAPKAIPSSVPVPESAPAPSIPAPTLKECIGLLLTHPWDFPVGAIYPSVGKAYLLIAIVLTLIGLVASAGSTLKLIPAALLIAALWGTFVAVTVITSSILGFALTWSEGAALISLAGLPLLIRLVGGCLLSIVTTLSPFYFTGSPALFIASNPLWLRRLDLFELSSAGLFALLLSRRSGDRAKARLLSGIVWIVGIALAVAFEHWGVGL